MAYDYTKIQTNYDNEWALVNIILIDNKSLIGTLYRSDDIFLLSQSNSDNTQMIS